MTNKTIQDRLSFLALAGTNDAVYENRMFINRRRKQNISVLLEASRTKKGFETNQCTQLSLF